MLITFTHHPCAAGGKVALPRMRVLVRELVEKLATFPVTVSFSMTVAPLTKPLPLMVKVCELFDPVTGSGLTLVIEGDGTGSCTWNEY